MSQHQPVAPMFQVKTMQPADFLFAVELANTMNWNMTVEDFQHNMRLEPNGCFTLYEDAGPVGVATCISFGKVGWFGNLIVSPKCRGKGAGTTLTKHAVDYLQGLGAQTIGLYAYKHLVKFYGEIGFKQDQEFTVLKAERIHATNPEPSQRATEHDVPAIVEFDKGCFGAPRRKLLQPLLTDKDNPAFIITEENQLAGYSAGKVYGSFAEVGPLVCKRNQTQRGVQLLNAVLSELRNFEAWICLPTTETELLKAAVEAGFGEDFRVARMFLGSHGTQDCVYIAESLERG